MDNKNNDGFFYTYSAKEQAEIKKIREKYTTKEKTDEEDKMERLRRLDARVTQKAQVVAIVLGIIGSLILGFGMSLFMSQLGVMLGMDAGMAMIMGVIVGVFGGILICLAYPIYELIVKQERKRIAPEIIRITDELMK